MELEILKQLPYRCDVTNFSRKQNAQKSYFKTQSKGSEIVKDFIIHQISCPLITAMPDGISAATAAACLPNLATSFFLFCLC